MRKISVMAAAFFCCIISMTLLTACKDDSPTPQPSSTDKDLVGDWVADLTGKTYVMWSSGNAWDKMTFKDDGTGVSDVYYTITDEPVAREHKKFTFNAKDGRLTMHLDEGDKTFSYTVSEGKLTLEGNGSTITFTKSDSEKSAKFNEWSQKDLQDVPAPARYTIFVYGNAGGKMDYIIEEGFWEKCKQYLTDSTNVRVVCLYKYGKDTSSTITGDGDVVWFELNSKTDIENLRAEGMNVLDLNAEAIALKLYDPDMLQLYMEMSSLLCPAEEYVFAVWGHGDGFDPTSDVPGKYPAAAKTRGVLHDEWNNDEKLDMYELTQAIKGTGHAPFKTIFFHNCLMGNIETLTELQDVAEYIVCSSHELCSSGELLTYFVKGLIDTKSTAAEMQNGNAQNTNIEDAFAQMLQDVTPFWQESYTEEPTTYLNGDLKLIRTKGLDAIIDVCKRLATRLIELYPQNPEPINLANRQVYRFTTLFDDPDFGYIEPFFDLQDYADKLAANTADPTLASIAEEMKKALDAAIIKHAHVNWNEQHLDHYSLSICLYHQILYNLDFKARGAQLLCNINEGYEQSTFHKLTRWGNWLRINNGLPWGNPTSGGGEALTKE